MGLLRLGKMPPTIAPRATVMDAVDAMARDRTGAIAIVEDGRPVGIFTERDLLERVVARRLDPHALPIAEVMTAGVRSVPDGTPVKDALALMRANHFRHLAIVDDDGKLKGMVALRYLLYDLMDDLAAKVDDLHGYLMQDSRGG